MRAILKATDLCANEPARVARTIVDRRFTDRYDYALRHRIISDIFLVSRQHAAKILRPRPVRLGLDGLNRPLCPNPVIALAGTRTAQLMRSSHSFPAIAG
jgi:hypothetical protein